MLELAKEPLITLGALSRPHGVGTPTLNAIMARLGIKPTRFPNGRLLLNWEQSQRISAEMQKRRTR
jgi:hypothetical protein